MTGLLLYNSFWFGRPSVVYLIKPTVTANSIGHVAAATKLAEMIAASRRFSVTEKPLEDAAYFNVPLRQVFFRGEWMRIK
jgi:hypothetical protein